MAAALRVRPLPRLRTQITCQAPAFDGQSRTFIDSLLSSALGSCPLRVLKHTKTLPYSSTTVFKAVSDVSGYPSFLPFTISSSVTARDEAGYPTRAQLKVGYDKLGIEENWDNVVSCDPKRGAIEAHSSETASQGLFETLQTLWLIEPVQNKQKDQTSVKLEVNVKFRNPVYDQMFAQVENKVANAMISAFEKRVHDLEQKQRRS